MTTENPWTNEDMTKAKAGIPGRWSGFRYIESAPSIWYSDSLPSHWIIEGSDDAIYLVPARQNGWAARRAYRGHRKGLKRVDPATARTLEASLNAGFDFMMAITRPWARTRYMDEEEL